MKRFLLLVMTVMCILGSGAMAQITIHESDFSLLPYTSITGRDSSSAISPGASGANKTWDFSAMNPSQFDTALTDATNFTPSPDFPTANIGACSSFGFGSFCAYYTISSTELTVLGSDIALSFFGNTTHAVNVLTPAELIYPFPLNYSQTNSQSFVENQLSVYTPPQQPDNYDSSRTIFHKSRTFTVDGWGTLITPYGSFNSLRVFEITTSLDSTFNHVAGGSWSTGQVNALSIDSSYTWLANNVFQVASLSRNSSNSYDYSILKSTALAGLKENTDHLNAVHIYPNPAAEQVTIEMSLVQNTNVEIFNVQGRLVASFVPQTQSTVVNISDFSPGLYFVKIISPAGSSVHKLVRQ